MNDLSVVFPDWLVASQGRKEGFSTGLLLQRREAACCAFVGDLTRNDVCFLRPSDLFGSIRFVFKSLFLFGLKKKSSRENQSAPHLYEVGTRNDQNDGICVVCICINHVVEASKAFIFFRRSCTGMATKNL